MTPSRVLLTLAALLGLSLSLVFSAAAKTATKPVVKASQNADVGKKIVVDAQGRTLYILKPETKSKLLCTSSQCLAAWPLATVKSKSTKLVKGKGVSGKLTLLKRGNKYQLLLGGKPLYRFASDTKGKASGEGIKSFGGTWLTLAASGSSSGTTTTPPTTTDTIPGY